MEVGFWTEFRNQVIYNMYNTTTNTYTVLDIRKTFESLEADIRTIVRRTNTWDIAYVDDVLHDVLVLAENDYLATIDVTQLDANDKPLHAVRYTINTNGTVSSGDRAGQNNDWMEVANSKLVVILSYTPKWREKTDAARRAFMSENGFRINWVRSSIDTRYPGLTSSQAQTYASNGYELSKRNFK